MMMKDNKNKMERYSSESIEHSSYLGRSSAHQLASKSNDF
jgi:hypothetical protein